MDSGEARQKALNFLRSKVVTVIATVNQDGHPMAATVYFAVDDDFTFYFMTKVSTHKFLNLQNNQHVAMVVGTENIPTTVQIEGQAEKLEQMDKKLIAQDKVARNSLEGAYGPPLNKLPVDELAVFQVKPTFIKFMDQTDQSGRYNQPVQIIP